MATKEEMLAQAAQRKLQSPSMASDTKYWLGETGDDLKRLASKVVRGAAGVNTRMAQDASRWDTLHNPEAMAQYQGPPEPMSASSIGRMMMDPAQAPVRPAGSMAEAVQQAGALVPGGLPEGWVKGKSPANTQGEFSNKGTFPTQYQWTSPDKTGTAFIRQLPYGRHSAYYHKEVPGMQPIIEHKYSMPNKAAAFEFIQNLINQHHPE
jgi:hypothetical protein